MRICYVLLSPTFGMHQYTADLANRMAAAGHDVHLVTTDNAPWDRYATAVRLHLPLTTSGTGFSREGASLPAFRRTRAAICGCHADLVHFTGVHLWNVRLVRSLQRSGVPVVHSLHDLDPHRGRRFGGLIRFWNQLLLRSGCHILVHGRYYQHRILEQGFPADKVTSSPLLHLCFSHERESALRQEQAAAGDPLPCDAPDPGPVVTYEPFALFFGRLEAYKGVQPLLAASTMMNDRKAAARGATSEADPKPAVRVVLAGPGRIEALWPGPLPSRVELRNRLIEDEEAADLLRRCGLLVLPYLDATQSALVGLGYFFRKPVLVTRAGALPEYVEDGRTGWVVEPGDTGALARGLSAGLADPARLAEMGRAGRAWYDAMREQEWQTLTTMYERLAKPGAQS